MVDLPRTMSPKRNEEKLFFMTSEIGERSTASYFIGFVVAMLIKSNVLFFSRCHPPSFIVYFC